MPTRKVRMSLSSDCEVDATVSIDTGKPIVTVASTSWEMAMTPREAEIFALFVIEAACCCRAKMLAEYYHTKPVVLTRNRTTKRRSKSSRR